ncbi:MAG: DeoR family transcriptional regulator [Alkalispirochaeta sp.]
MMISHYHGQLLNYSELSRAFGVSDHTVRRYLEILDGTGVRCPAAGLAILLAHPRRSGG